MFRSQLNDSAMHNGMTIIRVQEESGSVLGLLNLDVEGTTILGKVKKIFTSRNGVIFRKKCSSTGIRISNMSGKRLIVGLSFVSSEATRIYQLTTPPAGIRKRHSNAYFCYYILGCWCPATRAG